MIAEMIFLLLIVGVLGGILFSVYIGDSKSSRALTEPSRAVHEANYLRYLSYVPDAGGDGGEDGAGGGEEDGGERPRRHRAAAQALRVPVRRPDPWQSASVLVPSGPSGSRAPADVEPGFDVVILEPGAGEPATTPPAASRPTPGAHVIGALGAPEASGADAESGTTRRESGTLVLIGAGGGAPSGEPPPGPKLADSTEPRTRRGGRLRRVEFVPRSADLWTRWPDAHRRVITGTIGVAALGQALDLLQKTDAHSVADDLIRKGIEISFGDSEEFSDADHQAARFIYTDADPPRTPTPPPVLRLNPRFKDEDPRVLAAVLAHEGAHFQQYLDGTLRRGRASRTELEARAWTSGAVVWQQMRRTALPLRTPLVRDLEVGYQIARQGEGLLRDFMAALYADD
jgi:hypothetical protein